MPELLKAKQTDTSIQATDGTRAYTGKVQGVSTGAGDPGTTLVTKDYVDGSVGAAPTPDDKFQNPLASSGEASATGITITNTPAIDSWVNVFVNTAGPYSVGNGVKVGVACFFSGDGGTTARLIADIAAGDELFWNGVTAGFELEVADEVSMDYAA